MTQLIRIGLFTFTLSLVLLACSTEKNTFVNRTYHGMTAKYNGHFNATELLRLAIGGYRNGLQEDFYNRLPIDVYPNEEEVVALYPAIDTAIVKCTKVIQKHSMPSNDKPSKKKEEHNPWIDENWITIGIAQYYRRDYDAAMKSFMFVKKFYSNDPTLFVGEMWMAKTNIQMGKLTEAGFNLANLDKAIEAENDPDVKDKKPSSKKGKKEEVAKVPKSIFFDLEKTKAELALKKDDKKKAVEHLAKSLEYAKKSADKGRVNFVIGQLNEEMGDQAAAKAAYSKVLKYNVPYAMEFNARLKRAFMGGDSKVEQELRKMLRDAKNAQYKDQIYYSLADIELQRGNKIEAKKDLTLSAFYSTSNNRQKAMSFEKLGNMSYSERNYVYAQKYYDSCVAVLPDNYPNGDGIRNKALKLADLVVAVETANYEDSVQRIAALSESDRTKFIEDVIKKIKEDEKNRKEAEARRLRELQQNQNNFVQTNGSGNKWYFNNPKTRSEGYEEFKKLWGVRDNEDDWRRSDKTTFAIINPDEEDTTQLENAAKPKADSLTVDMLLTNIPLTDSLLQASIDREMNALYAAGIIYKEQLKEADMARAQFNKILAKNKICDTDLSASYQLYKMKEGSPDGDIHKDHILVNYPNSDYANYIRDPNFFIKRKEMEALAVQEYVNVLERYNRGLYYPVISKANDVITNERDNPYRAKYMLLKAMSTGQINPNKHELVPILEQVLADYPGSSEAKRAQEMLDVIANGYSANIEVDFTIKSIYKYNDKAEHWVIVFLDKNESSNVGKTKVADFNREFFSRDKLKTSTKIFKDDQSIVLIQQFDNDLKAKEYIRVFKQTRKHLMDLQKAKIMAITQENMKVLFESGKLAEYDQFYEENY
jgi:tetratricopeptide (TPR) repeat protein